MSPELLSRFEPVAREQLKQVVTNRVSQFFTVDSYKIEGKDPLVVRFLGERITYVGRTETERKPYQYRLTLRFVERTQQNPYGLVVSSVEQTATATASAPYPQSKISPPHGIPARPSRFSAKRGCNSANPLAVSKAARILQFILSAKRALPMHGSVTRTSTVARPRAPRGVASSSFFCDPCMQQNLTVARHNNLKLVQRNNLIIAQRENLIRVQHDNLTIGKSHGNAAGKAGRIP
jgi:hypothetical protein